LDWIDSLELKPHCLKVLTSSKDDGGFDVLGSLPATSKATPAKLSAAGKADADKDKRNADKLSAELDKELLRLERVKKLLASAEGAKQPNAKLLSAFLDNAEFPKTHKYTGHPVVLLVVRSRGDDDARIALGSVVYGLSTDPLSRVCDYFDVAKVDPKLSFRGPPRISTVIVEFIHNLFVYNVRFPQ